MNAPDNTITSEARPARVPAIACRPIEDADALAVVDLLCDGFKDRPRGYWAGAVATLGRRPVPDGCPRYGYCLTADGTIVGLILLIYATLPHDRTAVRCSVSSWTIRPRYSLYAASLVNAAMRRTRGVYVNSSSIASTREAVVAQGFSCFAKGTILSVPAIGRPVPGLAIERVGEGAATAADPDRELLKDHAGFGCVSLSCTAGGQREPFVFLRRRIPHLNLPCAQLIYCRAIEAFVGWHGPIGRYLLARGMPVVMLDANGPIPGLPGHYFDGRGPKYFRGAAPPRLGDLAYSEAVLFGP